MVRAGHPGWTGLGGHGSGRKLPIVFAGLLLGDERLANINKNFPKACFGEDEQTAYGDCWTGAKVVFTGHSGIDEATGIGRDTSGNQDLGPYEHTQPSTWGARPGDQRKLPPQLHQHGWVAQALALRLLHAEKAWNHDAFFDYVDRWMYEDDDPIIKVLKAAGHDYDQDWSRQGHAGRNSSTRCGRNTAPRRACRRPTAGSSSTMIPITGTRSRGNSKAPASAGDSL